MKPQENKIFTAETEADLQKVAQEIHEAFPDINIYALTGDLGSGKTAFVKAFCKFAGVEDDVSSPTFGIVNEYFSPKFSKKIFHFDLYRLNTVHDLHNIGFGEYIDADALVFIEWPELAKHFLDMPYMEIKIEPKQNGSRTFTCEIIKK